MPRLPKPPAGALSMARAARAAARRRLASAAEAAGGGPSDTAPGSADAAGLAVLREELARELERLAERRRAA